eukprot:TRINITY_DN936_c0_g1_i12.p1 TRINITY_DN936_c0_g1~~TRINITY_DN936_c0_g1_i12.p1  ORF type:complete len:163 (+),score=21.51 TRINITY_DN936_c0_g1_i12:116-604(+)
MRNPGTKLMYSRISQNTIYKPDCKVDTHDAVQRLYREQHKERFRVQRQIQWKTNKPLHTLYKSHYYQLTKSQCRHNMREYRMKNEAKMKEYFLMKKTKVITWMKDSAAMIREQLEKDLNINHAEEWYLHSQKQIPKLRNIFKYINFPQFLQVENKKVEQTYI